jgi:hypothetical protein
MEFIAALTLVFVACIVSILAPIGLYFAMSNLHDEVRALRRSVARLNVLAGDGDDPEPTDEPVEAAAENVVAIGDKRKDAA